jgi:hypothetical protein
MGELSLKVDSTILVTELETVALERIFSINLSNSLGLAVRTFKI